MLCMIGDFQFRVNDTSYDQFTSSTDYPFVENERIGDYNSYQSVGKEEQTDSISGELIAKSINALVEFENLAAKKEEQTIAFSTGVAYTVIIRRITKTRSSFLRDGAFLKQSYQIELKKVGQ